ncbi:hypothetical protein ACH4TP_18130 [Streptomyces sp. NPDC021012]|uniref:hypothetical protein n=1 Tax=Streptomyces sp. NPDC021012 TaxID=3365107 RepID=UPI0037A64CAE
MAGTYALISPDGLLHFHEGVPGTPGQIGGLPRTTLSTFGIQHAGWGGPGLHGHTVAADGPVGAHRFNRAASSVASVLGGPDQSILDSLVIWGERDEPGSGPAIPCGLTEAQQHLIQDVHRAVLEDACIDGRGGGN